jgi:uncharacterized protein YegP (UPF0339 family)
MTGKFVVFQDDSGRYRFHLRSGNGQVIATGTAYSTKKACLSGIDSIRRNVPGATLDDQAS